MPQSRWPRNRSAPGCARWRRVGSMARGGSHAHVDDDEIALGEFKPLLPEGHWFEVRFDGHSTALIFNTPKVFWEFTIVEAGDWFDQKLFRAFRVPKVMGRPGKKGKFVMAPGGDMYQTLVRLLDVKQRADRISMSPLRHIVLKVRTRTVCVNYRREPLPDHMRYSVVDAIERAN